MLKRERTAYNERFNRSLCVDDDDEDERVEVPKKKFDFIPKLALALHLLEQSLSILIGKATRMTSEISLATINKAVTVNKHFQFVKVLTTSRLIVVFIQH